MSAKQSIYYIEVNDVERGPFTLSQLSLMWVAGYVTADALYRLDNLDQWTPLIDLATTLEAIATSSRSPEENNSVAGVEMAKEFESTSLRSPQENLPRTNKGEDIEQIRSEMISGPAGKKMQAVVANLILSKGLLAENRQAVAHLENIAAGRPQITHLKTGEECQRDALAFRLRWAFIHLLFWVIAGAVWLGPKSVFGIIPSLIVLGLQLDWKKRQLLVAMGLTEAEIRQRVPPFLPKP